MAEGEKANFLHLRLSLLTLSRMIRSVMRPFLLLASLIFLSHPLMPQSPTVPLLLMQKIRHEVKTSHKYGVVIEPPVGKKVDCPAVFRYRPKWYMVYVQFEAPPSLGYTTQLAESADLLHWKPLGTISAL